MSSTDSTVEWMLTALAKDGCLYQDDVVDHLVKTDNAVMLMENSDGNEVLGRSLLNEFKKATEPDVVWVKSGRYWRYRVAEDEPGRDARG